MGMDTDALRWFQQVADGTTVTEVSEVEPVTQSGVSRALARLEAEVGTPLLRKSGRTLRMTLAGTVFKRHVDAMLHHLDDGIAAVNQLLDPDSGTVALAFQHSLGSWLVPDLVSSFRARHPEHPLPAHRGARRAPRPAAQRRPGRPGDRHPRPARPGPALPPGRRRAAAGGPAPRPPAGQPAGRRSAWPRWRASRSWPCAARPPCASSATTCARRPGSGPTWCSRATTCRPCAASWPPAWAWPSCRRRAQARRSRAPGPLRYCEIDDVWAAREITLTLVGGAAAAAGGGGVPSPRHGQGGGGPGPGPHRH